MSVSCTMSETMTTVLLLFLLLFLAPALGEDNNATNYKSTLKWGWNVTVDSANGNNHLNLIGTELRVRSRTQNADTWYWLVFMQIEGSQQYWKLSIVLWDNYVVQVVWSVDHALGINSTLTFVENDGLILINEAHIPVWSACVPNATEIHLSIDGYMFIVDQHNQSLWSSFNSPINYLVCGQVVRNGTRLLSGNYSFAIDSTSAALDYMQYPYQKWSLDPNSLDETVFAALCCDQSGAYLQIRSDVGNVSENNYLLVNWVGCNDSPSVTQILSLSVVAADYVAFASLDEGTFSITRLWGDKNSTFQGHEACILPNSCGPYGLCANGSCLGCVLNDSYVHPFTSQNDSSSCKFRYNAGDCEMIRISGIDYYQNTYALPNVNSIDELDCKTLCTNRPGCEVAFYQAQHRYCFLVDNVESVRYVNESYAAFFKACQPYKTNATHKGALLKLVMPLVTAFIVGVVACGLLILTIRCKNTKRVCRRNDEDEEEEEDEVLAAYLFESTLRKFLLGELEEITNGFREKLALGGFGVVYKGVLKNGGFVAVKILNESSQLKAQDFYAELSILSRVRHLNLVQLLGFCATKSIKALVYEYMGKGSLDHWITCDNGQLSWETRMKIAVGSAKGLAYLHEECASKILHLDVKPENILLDENFLPKVADFGLSRLMDRKETGIFMTTLRGTPGYLSPELCKGGAIDVKSDVYSFGIVVIEILSGRKFGHMKTQEIWGYSSNDMIHEFVDEKLKKSFNVDEAKRMLSVALLCINQDPALRPMMSTVVQMLEKKQSIPSILLQSQLKRMDSTESVFSCSTASNESSLEFSSVRTNSSLHGR